MKRLRAKSHLMIRVAMVVALVATALISTAAPAIANQIFATDCDFDWPITFHRNQIVCVTGDVDTVPPGHFFPAADAYVVTNRVWSDGDVLRDRTPGGANFIQGSGFGGSFYDEEVWLPPLKPGQYDLVLDEDLNGRYDEGLDFVLGERTGYAFRVIDEDLAGYSVNVAAIKADAASQRDHWSSLDLSLGHVGTASSGIFGVSVYDSLRTAGFPFLARLGAGFGAVVINREDGATDYSGVSIVALTKIGSSLAQGQAQHFDDLANDPADPNYGEEVLLDFDKVNEMIADSLGPTGIEGSYPFTPRTDEPEEARMVSVVNLVAEETAIVRGVMQAHEKFLGARNADDVDWAVVHARQLERYADMLADSAEDVGEALFEVRGDLATVPANSEVVDVDGLATLQQRLETSGFTTEEIRDYRNKGFSDTQAERFADQFIDAELPDEDFTVLDVIDALLDDVDAFVPTAEALAVDAGQVANDIESEIEAVAEPLAVLATPPAPTAGVSMTLDASDSNGATTPLTYEWDLDLDGDFDDAAGAQPSFTPPQAESKLVGVRVVDALGLVSVDYALLEVTSANAPPDIDLASPTPGDVSAEPGDNLSFSVSASDPESETLSYEWELDGTLVSTSSSFNYSPLIGDAGIHLVGVRISDSNPYSRDSFERWEVVVLTDDDDGDGWRAHAECDDNDLSVNPGQTEIPGNGKDDDCNPATPD